MRPVKFTDRTPGSSRERSLAALVALALLLPACTAETPAPFVPAPTPAASATPAPVTPPLDLVVTPAKDARNLPISAEVGTKVVGGKVDSVVLTDAAGAKVAGKMRADGTSFVPAKPLKWATAYKATVIASDASGKTVTQATSFTTMKKTSAKRTGTGLYMFADREYGTAMPVVVEFESDVPKSSWASVQSRLFVTTTPDQPGVWHWTGPRQVMYRGPEYWQPGTKIEVRIALEGHPMGNGRFGHSDRIGVGNISKNSIEMFVDNATKKMTVKKNGAVIKTIPVSLGKPKTPSSSGTLVIMDKKAETVFDTRGVPGEDPYVVDIKWAQRLTWKGEFIHAAPWSVKSQGKTNVSHGCVNMSTANAQWLFGITRIGDPVVIKGTERQVVPGNGFTAWSLTWEEWQKGSAL